MVGQYVTKQELDRLLAPILDLITMDSKDRGAVSATRFHIPLTATTSVKVEFVGPVGVDEYDSFLAHIAFYKQMVPKKGADKLAGLSVSERIREEVDRIWERRDADDKAGSADVP